MDLEGIMYEIKGFNRIVFGDEKYFYERKTPHEKNEISFVRDARFVDAHLDVRFFDQCRSYG